MSTVDEYQHELQVLYAGMATNTFTRTGVEQRQAHLADLWSCLNDAEQLDIKHLIASFNALGPSWFSADPFTAPGDAATEDAEFRIVAFHGPCGQDRCGARLPIFQKDDTLWVYDPWTAGGPFTYPPSHLEPFVQAGAAILAESDLPRGVSPANAVVLCAGHLLAELSAPDHNPLPRRRAAGGAVYYSIESRVKAHKRIVRWSRFLRELTTLERVRPKPDDVKLQLLARGIRDCLPGKGSKANPSSAQASGRSSSGLRPIEASWVVPA